MDVADREVLDGTGLRPRAVAAVAAGLVLAIAVGAGVVRSAQPPPPLSVALDQLNGSALSGDSYVRLHVRLHAEGADSLGLARLTLGGATTTGVHPAAFEDGRMTVQVELAPACPTVRGGVGTGLLELEVRDADGQDRTVRLDVPTDDRLDRLVRYPCR